MAHNLIEVHHNIATRLIVTYGSERQKLKYLPKLATGEMLATLCVQETKTNLDFRNTKVRYGKSIAKSLPHLDAI